MAVARAVGLQQTAASRQFHVVCHGRGSTKSAARVQFSTHEPRRNVEIPLRQNAQRTTRRLLQVELQLLGVGRHRSAVELEHRGAEERLVERGKKRLGRQIRQAHLRESARDFLPSGEERRLARGRDAHAACRLDHLRIPQRSGLVSAHVPRARGVARTGAVRGVRRRGFVLLSLD